MKYIIIFLLMFILNCDDKIIGNDISEQDTIIVNNTTIDTLIKLDTFFVIDSVLKYVVLLDTIKLVDTITNLDTIKSVDTITNLDIIKSVDTLILVDSLLDTIIQIDTVDRIDTLTRFDTLTFIDTVLNMDTIVTLDTLLDTVYSIDTIETIDTLTDSLYIHDTLIVIDTIYEAPPIMNIWEPDENTLGLWYHNVQAERLLNNQMGNPPFNESVLYGNFGYVNSPYGKSVRYAGIGSHAKLNINPPEDSATYEMLFMIDGKFMPWILQLFGTYNSGFSVDNGILSIGDIAGQPYDPINVSLNEWHYVAMVLTGTNIILYFDGVKRFNITMKARAMWQQAYIGFDETSNSSTWFMGYIDELRISTTMRTEREILETWFKFKQ